MKEIEDRVFHNVSRIAQKQANPDLSLKLEEFNRKLKEQANNLELAKSEIEKKLQSQNGKVSKSNDLILEVTAKFPPVLRQINENKMQISLMKPISENTQDLNQDLFEKLGDISVRQADIDAEIAKMGTELRGECNDLNKKSNRLQTQQLSVINDLDRQGHCSTSFIIQGVIFSLLFLQIG